MQPYVLALDQGTTSSRAILFDRRGRIVASAQQELPQILPRPGEVEHDPEAIWESQTSVARQDSGPGSQSVRNRWPPSASRISAKRRSCGNATRASRSTMPSSGRVGSVRGICQQLRSGGYEPIIREKTGLLLDPYFSGTKIRYLLDMYPSLRGRAERGEVLFGTVDSFLIWRLTGGRHHVTDVSNASRTLLLNLHTLDWDDELLQILGVPRAMLPEVRPSSQVYGRCEASLFGREIPIAGDAGDQQAATFGQACFAPGHGQEHLRHRAASCCSTRASTRCRRRTTC